MQAFLRAAIAAVALSLATCSAAPAFAQIAKPNGWQLPTATLSADYGSMPIAAWAWDTGVVGEYVGIFERHADGNWYGCRSNPTPDSNFEAKVSQMGADAYLASMIPALNAALAACYPPIGAHPSPAPLPANAGGVDSVNFLLQGYHFVLVNGVETLVHN